MKYEQAATLNRNLAIPLLLCNLHQFVVMQSQDDIARCQHLYYLQSIKATEVAGNAANLLI